MDKKRDLLEPLTNVINAFMTLHSDAAKLEFSDNDQASRRLKLALSNIENGELKALKRAVLDTRKEINELPQRVHIKHDKQFKPKNTTI